MYILISNDGTVNKVNKLYTREYNLADTGKYVILNAVNMTQYINGEWIDIKPF